MEKCSEKVNEYLPNLEGVLIIFRRIHNCIISVDMQLSNFQICGACNSSTCYY